MKAQEFDVIIVGAGLSGIGAACHLEARCPGISYTILEGRESLGGTWDLFRYPGIRSDSDMHTLGYSFRPWRESKAIADGPAILAYIRETASEYGIEKRIQYGCRVVGANYSSDAASWIVETEAAGGSRELRGRLLYMCTGYYNLEHGYLPAFDGQGSFQGTFIHPQNWPEDLDYENKRVIVIGSGATAMTIVPEMAKSAAQVTMLQRSPTYVISRPTEDAIANIMRTVLPERAAYALTRWKNIFLQHWLYRQTRQRPERIKRKLLKWVQKELGSESDVEQHFTPSYAPWDQRLCLLPDSDLFAAIRAGKVTVATEHIDTFTAEGIRLSSGESLAADIIVAATGLELVPLGQVGFRIDDAPVDFAKTFTYRGVMYSGVPNMVSTFGYINASWTLRADLVAEFFCRLVNHLRETGCDTAIPELREEDRGMPERPWITGFSSGYLQRYMQALPKQGDREPWLNPQYYLGDRKRFRCLPLDDGVLRFSRRTASRGKAA